MAWSVSRLGPGGFDAVDQFTNSSVFGAHAQEYTDCRHFGTGCFSIDAISPVAFQFAAISLVSPLLWEIETYTRY